MNEKFKMTKLLIDAGVTWYPTQVADHILADKEIKHAFELLKAEKEGKLIMPPCKVGDTVYVVDVCAKEVIERKIMEIRQTEWGMIYIHSCGFGYPVTSIGKTVFLSREEAEKALKGVE